LNNYPFLSFLIFWAINVFIIVRGIESIKFLETYAAPLLLASGVVLLIWAIVKTGQTSGVGTGGFWAGLPNPPQPTLQAPDLQRLLEGLYPRAHRHGGILGHLEFKHP